MRITYFLFLVLFSIPMFALQPVVDIPCPNSPFECGSLEGEAERYYREEGEWKGVFTMQPVRSVHAGGNICHIRYNYFPVPGNGFRVDTGFDYRAFTFKLDKKTCKWKAYFMGDYLSGPLAK
jgi:hypothetical protein